MQYSGTGVTELTHLDDTGAARMVDVSAKPSTKRTAVAGAAVLVATATLAAIRENTAKKGDVLGVARVAGIVGAKKTYELVPLCHPIPISSVEIDFQLQEEPDAVLIEAKVTTTGPTGVEMEALAAVTVAALTVYDMIKSVDRSASITDVKLLFKDGGKSGRFDRRR